VRLHRLHLALPLCLATAWAAATAQTIIPIANIQDSISHYDGQTVTLEGVSLGDNGDLWPGRTSVYIQDDSGWGIQVFDYNNLYPWNRGDRIKVTGEIEDYQGGNDYPTTEIIPSSAPSVEATGQPLPTPAQLTTAAANDEEHEGRYVQITGQVTEPIFSAGGGSNVSVDDGSGQITVRVWDSIGIDLGAVDEGDSISVKGIVSPYDSDFQVLLVDQEDLWVGGPWSGGTIEPGTCDDPTPIAAIQDSLHLWDGREVTIRGVVTVGYGLIRDDFTSIYVQDESGKGINVFDFDPRADLVRGTEVCITGVVEDYISEPNLYGTTELTNLTDITVISTGAELPAARLLTVRESSSFAWDGTLITVNGWVTETPSNAGGGWNVPLSDGSGSTTMRVWDTTNLGDYIEQNVTRDQLIEVTGIGSVYNDAFQVLLAYQDDLNLAGTPPDGLDTLEVATATVSVPRPLFAPRAGERVRVVWNAPPASYVWIQVFDVTGRAVATLHEGANAPPYGNRDLYWDGRDRLNQRLQAGTYVVNVRASQTGDGSTSSASAPIVIGARLD